MTQPAAHSIQPKSQPWIHSAALDSLFILSPPLIVSMTLLLFPDYFNQTEEVPPWIWMSLIVGVDVAHVYSSLYRTYFDREEFSRRSAVYLLTPLFCWAAGAILYSLGALVFWRILAYLAVFHFIRQQYGFMMIYGRGERHHPWWLRRFDVLVIYATMLFPLLYWHTHLPRNFNWFIEGDFIALPRSVPENLFLGLYGVLLVFYVVKEGLLSARDRMINFPKNLLVLGTAAAWSIGIIFYNGDLAFTATNVIAHGIPYTALVWIYCHRKWSHSSKEKRDTGRLAPQFYSVTFLPLFLGLLFFFAYVEEGAWDILIWRDHPTLFGQWSDLWQVSDHQTLSWLVPLLALPQMTHYVLDGFIWRMNRPDSDLKQILLKD
jgi:hypothetical protein